PSPGCPRSATAAIWCSGPAPQRPTSTAKTSPFCCTASPKAPSQSGNARHGGSTATASPAFPAGHSPPSSSSPPADRHGSPRPLVPRQGTSGLFQLGRSVGRLPAGGALGQSCGDAVGFCEQFLGLVREGCEGCFCRLQWHRLVGLLQLCDEVLQGDEGSALVVDDFGVDDVVVFAVRGL